MRGGVEADPAIRSVLGPGEELLWSSRPGAVGLFVSVLPAILRDLILLALIMAAALLLDRATTARWLYLVLGGAAVLLAWSLVGSLRKALAAPISWYAITEQRLIVMLPRERPAPDLIRCRSGSWEAVDQWRRKLDGPARHGAIRAGRATVRVEVDGYFNIHAGQYGTLTRRLRRTYRLIGVTEPDRAVALLNRSRGA